MNGELSAHLRVKRYGDFLLTDAVRPAPEVPMHPREGYRIRVYRDPFLKVRLPLLTAALSAEKLFEVFLDLLVPLGEEAHVVLEGSHHTADGRHADFRRNRIDLPVLQSYFCDHEDLLLDDGCTGVAVLAARGPMEVQLDEHKLINIYAADLKPFRRILRSHGVKRKRILPLISEYEHFHHSTPEQADEFESLCLKLGVTDNNRVFSDESY